jgi:hypothetical protein
MAGLLLIAGIVAADAAPNIPPGEMPGRERERFTPSPVDRFTDPFAWPRTEPLYRFCNQPSTRRAKQKRPKRNQGC